jgi:hypothetical protein
MTMIELYDAATNARLGAITEEQLQFMTDQLEEESLTDQDYYINQATLDTFQKRGAPAGLVELLRQGLAGREEMDIRWDRD